MAAVDNLPDLLSSDKTSAPHLQVNGSLVGVWVGWASLPSDQASCAILEASLSGCLVVRSSSFIARAGLAVPSASLGVPDTAAE